MPHQVFLDNLVKMMPFQGDEGEEGTALKCFIFLYTKNPDLVLPYRESLIKIIESDLTNTEKYGLSEPLLSNLREFLVKLQQ